MCRVCEKRDTEVKRMSIKEFGKKLIIAAAGTWIGEKLSLLIPMLKVLTVLMIIDYVSGMLAAKKEAIEYPDNKEFGWSSKKSRLGIYKKVGYIISIFAAAGTDYFIYCFSEKLHLKYNQSTVFSLLVTVWFILNELISVLENAGRMGVELPEFLRKVLSELKRDINDQSKQG